MEWIVGIGIFLIWLQQALIIQFLRKQVAMTQAASDLNLEAHQRLLDAIGHVEAAIGRPGRY